MAQLENIHCIAFEKLQKRFLLNSVKLKHPLPERPLRSLGMLKIEGKVFSSDEFLRVLIMNITIPFVRGIKTIFLAPRTELDLPVFSTEVILMGKKRNFFLDIQRRGGYERHDDSELYNRLIAIKDKYPQLFAETLRLGREIDKTFSKAVCYVKISKEQDDEALNLFHEYLDLFLELIHQAKPLTGKDLTLAYRDYEEYTKTVIDHDPAAKVYKMLFGKKGGVERIRELFFPALNY